MTPLLCTIALLSATERDYWQVDYLTPPKGAVLEVGGIGFMSNGDLIASTRRGQVWRVNNPHAKDPNDAVFTLICEGLHEGLGLSVVDDEILVLQRGELSKLVDLDGDTLIDEVQTITQDWGMTDNYHEFAFGLPTKSDGTMYASFNLGFWNPHWWHGKSRAPMRGWVIEIDKDGNVTPYAGGLRSPAGLGLLEDGTVLATDNQGDWMPVCPIFAVEKGKFYGHPASLRWFDGQPDVEPSDTQPPQVEREHPLLWIPYKWSRSTGNIIQNDTNGKFGPFDKQYYVAELTNGQILRATFEEIDGVRQGACWLSTQGVGSAYHIEFGPDGTMYAGMTNRGWGGLSPGHGIARIKPTGKIPFEMENIHLIEDGFEITFTKPLDSFPTITAETYDYNWWWEYGSPRRHVEALKARNIAPSADGKTLTVKFEGLESGTCVDLLIEGAETADGEALLHPEVSYTINKLPGGRLAHVAKEVTPPVERGERVEGWLYLSWLDAFGMWNNNGVFSCNADISREDPTKFDTYTGNGALVAHEGNCMTTTFDIEDCAFRMNFMLAEGAKATIDLPQGLQLLLSDSESGLTGAILDKESKKLHQPTRNAYEGAGVWHTVLVECCKDIMKIKRVELGGVDVLTDIPFTGVEGHSSIQITSIAGDVAFGDVRIKQIEPEFDTTGWKPLNISQDWHTENGAKVWIEDSGTIVIDGGIGTATTSVNFEGATELQFDVKIQGIGHSAVTFGDFAFDISTHGKALTGGTASHPVTTNLIDQNEWCTIRVTTGDGFTIYLNGFPIIQNNDPMILHGKQVTVKHRDCKVKLKQLLVK
ncbi:MAG: hypothetical protein MK073_03460 [Phycisphaerales bacterium]|nr:hypothetical protein [Phycisphaerales bacterium]